MPATFESVWRKVRLYVPGAPVFLVRTWVEDAYKTLYDRRQWAFKISQGQITWADAIPDLAVTVTWGSRTVTAVAATFLPTNAGRQFRVGSYPIYTIEEYVSAQEITLVEPYYGNATGLVTTGQILDAYATMPTNFGAFQVVTDQANQRLVPWWATQQELALIDPTRSSSSGSPRLLAASATSVYPNTLGQIQYEFWPKPTAQGSLQYYGTLRPVDLADSYVFQGVLRDRTDVLETGALAAAAKWPGTQDVKNPYFNMSLAVQLQNEFDALCNQLDIRDDDQFQQSWDTIPFQRWNGWSWAYDTHLLQATDATIGDYAGYFGGLGW